MQIDFKTGSSRLQIISADLPRQVQNGSVVLDSRRRRPLYFDGRFLAARDLAREQDYFLQRQADLGRAAGFGIVHGLEVDRMLDGQNRVVADGIVIGAGQGITPAGELVLLTEPINIRLSDLEEEQRLDLNFGMRSLPVAPRRTRTGLYVLALRPVEFTANPIASYPTSIGGTCQTHDGDIVEATAIALVPYPDPVSNADDPEARRALLASQIFSGQIATSAKISDSLLPLAIVYLERGEIRWVDEWLVRRVVSAEYAGQQFGITDQATQTAFFLHYDAHLQTILNDRKALPNPGSFNAAQYFRLLPPAGRFPLASIDPKAKTQAFFPQQVDVRMSIVPEDELPALVQDSLDLPPLDLTLPPDEYTQLALFALIPVPRANFAALKAKLATTPVQPAVPQILSFRRPIELLRLYRGDVKSDTSGNAGDSDWASAFGKNTFGFYVRRRSMPQFVDFASA